MNTINEQEDINPCIASACAFNRSTYENKQTYDNVYYLSIYLIILYTYMKSLREVRTVQVFDHF